MWLQGVFPAAVMLKTFASESEPELVDSQFQLLLWPGVFMILLSLLCILLLSCPSCNQSQVLAKCSIGYAVIHVPHVRA